MFGVELPKSYWPMENKTWPTEFGVRDRKTQEGNVRFKFMHSFLADVIKVFDLVTWLLIYSYLESVRKS